MSLDRDDSEARNAEDHNTAGPVRGPPGEGGFALNTPPTASSSLLACQTWHLKSDHDHGDDSNEHLWSAHSLPDIGLSTLRVCKSLNPHNFPMEKAGYYPTFADEKTEMQ